MENREIKFRAWINPEIIGGIKIHSEPYMAIQGEPDIEDLQSFMHHYSDAKILMQFTGLKDANGKDIYEGDILQSKGGDIMRVNWNEKFASFCLDKKGWLFSHYFGEAVDPNDCEVIGNIHEHPHLIK